MLGKTHVAVGVAASLAIVHPDTMPGVITAVAGGAVGGWISDIDLSDGEAEGEAGGFILTAIVTGLCLFVDYRVGGGICDFVISNWGIKTLAGILLFIAGAAYGVMVSSHRSFTHSILSVVVFTGALILACEPLALPFCIGMISHLLLDLPNQKGMQLLFPIKKRFCLNLCPSNGRANSVLMGIGTIAACILAGWFLINSFPVDNLNQYHSDGTLPWFTSFQWYLIIINVVTFLIMCIDHLIYDLTEAYDGDKQTFFHTIEDILALAGGGLGMLLSFLALRERIGKHNANWYVIVISQTLCWAIIYCIVCDPFNMGMEGVQGGWQHHIALIAYFLVINAITIVVFIRDRDTSRPKWKPSEMLLVFLGVIGGAFGGYLVMVLTNSKMHSPHFFIGFPVMMTAHAFIAGYLLLSGIA